MCNINLYCTFKYKRTTHRYIPISFDNIKSTPLQARCQINPTQATCTITRSHEMPFGVPYCVSSLNDSKLSYKKMYFRNSGFVPQKTGPNMPSDYNDQSTHKDYRYGMLRHTVRAVMIAKTRNPGACEITVTEAVQKHASFCEFHARRAGLLFGTILRSVGGKTSMPCEY
jgi:hypothetical protein